MVINRVGGKLNKVVVNQFTEYYEKMNYFGNDPSNIGKYFLIIFLFLIIVTLISLYYDFKKNKDNLKNIENCERALKDLIEAFRSQELALGDQKNILENYKYNLEKIDQEIARLGDSLNKESNITTAIKMANEGKSLEEISSATGMSKDEVEPIMKYHGKN